MTAQTKIGMSKLRTVAGSCVVSIPADLLALSGLESGDVIVVKVERAGRILLVDAKLIEELVR